LLDGGVPARDPAAGLRAANSTAMKRFTEKEFLDLSPEQQQAVQAQLGTELRTEAEEALQKYQKLRAEETANRAQDIDATEKEP
jgi:hypothetical protein